MWLYSAFRPFVKPSSTGVPLSVTSSHPDHVHRMWTRSRVAVLAKMSSHYLCFSGAKEDFLRRLRKFHFPLDIVRELEGLHSFTDRRVSALLASYSPRLRHRDRPSSFVLCSNRAGEESCFWIPLPWHSVFRQAGFSRIIKTMTEEPLFGDLLLQADGRRCNDPETRIQLRIAWMLRSQSFMASIRDLNKVINR